MVTVKLEYIKIDLAKLISKDSGYNIESHDLKFYDKDGKEVDCYFIRISKYVGTL